jgi:hypothetical protein
MEKDKLKQLEGFSQLLNKEPNKHELQMNKMAGNTMYLPISFLETTLDELYFGLWKTDGFTTRVIGNEICGELNLHVYHPIAEIWITRIGAAATMIRQVKDAGVMEADKKIKNALEMDYPHLKADCFRNACLSLGKSFGRDLNRKFIDSYKALLAGLEAGESQPQAKQLPEILPDSVDWKQGVDYLVNNVSQIDEAISNLLTKRRISDENKAKIKSEALSIVSQKQNSL